MIPPCAYFLSRNSGQKSHSIASKCVWQHKNRIFEKVVPPSQCPAMYTWRALPSITDPPEVSSLHPATFEVYALCNKLGGCLFVEGLFCVGNKPFWASNAIKYDKMRHCQCSQPKYLISELLFCIFLLFQSSKRNEGSEPLAPQFGLMETLFFNGAFDYYSGRS